MIMNGDRIYILILNYNSSQEVIRLYNSLKVDSREEYVFLIIDNLSPQPDREQLKKAIPDECLLLLNTNDGYASGNNAGIKQAMNNGATHILILNPDIEIAATIIHDLYIRFKSLEKTAALGTRICDSENPDIIYSDGGIINKEKGFSTKHHNGKKLTSEVSETGLREVDYVNGSVLFTSVAVLQDVGLLEESFFMYFEETEWCLRAKEKGYKLLVDTDLTAYHKPSSKNTRYQFLMIRNRLWLAKKYPKYYPKAKKVVFRKLKKESMKKLKRFQLPGKNTRAKIKGYLYGVYTSQS
ncbi:MAG: glycosyltransferase family 2 protein [Nonlabens sp.]